MRFIKLAAVLTACTLACGLIACKNGRDDVSSDKDVIKLGVVGSIYEDIWKPTKEKLAEEGIDLKIVQFSDYTTPNNALNNGEIDINAFQHKIYLDTEKKNYGYDIEEIGYTFIMPLNIYSKKIKSVDEIKDGDIIAIPNDVTNGGRALKVLEAAGLIKLKEEAHESPAIDDIESYNVKIQIKELSANTIPSALLDVTAAVINGNYALDYGLSIEEAIFNDTSINEDKYWNVIVARKKDIENEEKAEIYKKVIEAFQSQETEEVFDEKFGGFFIKAGWDKNILDK